MDVGSRAVHLLDSEARGLLSRLDRVKPFVLHETMVLAAALPYDAFVAHRAVAPSGSRAVAGAGAGVPVVAAQRRPHRPGGRAAAAIRPGASRVQ